MLAPSNEQLFAIFSSSKKVSTIILPNKSPLDLRRHTLLLRCLFHYVLGATERSAGDWLYSAVTGLDSCLNIPRILCSLNLLDICDKASPIAEH